MNNFDSNLGGYGMMNMMGGWDSGWGSFWFLIMSLGALAWVGCGRSSGDLAIQANRQKVKIKFKNKCMKIGA